MQTFVPYADFAQSARCLDRARLGKQRSEVVSLLNALLFGGGWSNHPAAKMWRGYEGALALYGMEICLEWQRRGCADTCFSKIDAMFPDGFSAPTPPWLTGDDCPVCVSHRSNLLRKMPEHYRQFGWSESDDLPYVWPVK